MKLFMGGVRLGSYNLFAFEYSKSAELFKIFCYLLKFSFHAYKVCNACEELESNAKCYQFEVCAYAT